MEDWSREWMLGENRRRSQCLGSVRQWGEPQGQSRSFSSFLHLSIMLQHIPCPLWKQLSQRMEVSWLWFLNKIERSAPPHPPVVWASFYLGRTMMEIHEMVGIERQLRFALGQLNSFFFRWHQEHSSGNVPSSFPFSVLLFLSPLSQSSELWDYDPEMGLVSIFQFLHFLLPLWEGREHCIIWTMVIMLFSPIH